MLTLFERVLYTGEEGNNKISIHLVQSLMSELGVDRLTVPQCIGIMGLDTTQANDFIRVLTAALSSTNKAMFAQRVFAYLVLAESVNRAEDGGLAPYLIEANFWLMIDAESMQ